MNLDLLMAIVRNVNNDPAGGLHVKEVDICVRWEGTIRIRIDATRRSGPYDNICIDVESSNTQDAVDRVEAMLRAASE